MSELPTERQEQIMLHEYCKLKNLISFAVPNGGTRHKLEAINLKREGVTKGVSDYVVLLPNKILFIEMKRKKKKLKNGNLSTSHTSTSKEQLEFIKRANKYDYVTATVCYGYMEARELIEKELK